MNDVAFAPKELPVLKDGCVDLLILAGEHSGDEHAARVLRELLGKRPDLHVCALGGRELAGTSGQFLHDLTATSVVGFVEVLKNYGYFRALFAATLAWIEKYQPSAVCFVDYPGFNMRLSAELRKRGLSRKGGGKIQTLYYISPQIWAWKPRRRFTMAQDLDGIGLIFPFELACYADTGLPAEFVGHPFLSADHDASIEYAGDAPVLLLPGSRVQTVERILPLLLAGFALYRDKHPLANAVVVYPSTAVLAVVQRVLARWQQLALAIHLQANFGNSAAICTKVSAVLTSSGTMSLHCALAGIPGAVVYKTDTLTYWLGRLLARVEFIGMANLLLKEPLYPEFIQGAATPEALAAELGSCLHDPLRLEHTRMLAGKLHGLLAQPAQSTAADWLARYL